MAGDTTLLEMLYQEAFNIPLNSVSGFVKISELDIDGDFTIEYTTGATAAEGWRPWPGEVFLGQSGTGDFMAIRVRIPAGATQGVMRELTFVNDPPDITESGTATWTGVGVERLTLTETYNTIKEVIVTLTGAQGAGTPVGYRVVDYNAAKGPHIQLLDSANAVVGGTFQYQVIGY